jgi:hypothetical protein
VVAVGGGGGDRGVLVGVVVELQWELQWERANDSGSTSTSPPSGPYRPPHSPLQRHDTRIHGHGMGMRVPMLTMHRVRRSSPPEAPRQPRLQRPWA